MFVRFKIDGSPNSGACGLINGFVAAATAPAGSTPDLPFGCEEFEVISNTEGGGHEVAFFDSDIAYAKAGLSTGNKLVLMSENQNAVNSYQDSDWYDMCFGVDIQSTNTSDRHWLTPFTGWYNRSNNTVVNQKTMFQAYFTTSYRGFFLQQGGVINEWVYLAVTKDYAVIWTNNDGDDAEAFSQHNNRLFAISYYDSNNALDSDTSIFTVNPRIAQYHTYNNSYSANDSTDMYGFLEASYTSETGSAISFSDLYNLTENNTTIQLDNAEWQERGPRFVYYATAEHANGFDMQPVVGKGRQYTLNPIMSSSINSQRYVPPFKMRGIYSIGYHDIENINNMQTQMNNANANFCYKKMRTNLGYDLYLLTVGAVVYGIPLQ